MVALVEDVAGLQRSSERMRNGAPGYYGACSGGYGRKASKLTPRKPAAFCRFSFSRDCKGDPFVLSDGSARKIWAQCWNGESGRWWADLHK